MTVPHKPKLGIFDLFHCSSIYNELTFVLLRRLAASSNPPVMTPAVFCTAEEAKPLVYELSRQASWTADLDTKPRSPFCFIGSRENLSGKATDIFPQLLHENDPFKSGFIDATVEECQDWLQKRDTWDPSIVRNTMLILDERSARDDDTVLVRHYFPKVSQYSFEKYGPLPPHTDTWYEWRVETRWAEDVIACVSVVQPNITYPVFFGIAERLTKDGVFDAGEAWRLTTDVDQDPEIFTDIIPRDEKPPDYEDGEQKVGSGGEAQ